MKIRDERKPDALTLGDLKSGQTFFFLGDTPRENGLCMRVVDSLGGRLTTPGSTEDCTAVRLGDGEPLFWGLGEPVHLAPHEAVPC